MKTITIFINEPTGPYEVTYKFETPSIFMGKSHYPIPFTILPDLLIYVFPPKSASTLPDHSHLVNYLMDLMEFNRTLACLNLWGVNIVANKPFSLIIDLFDGFFTILDIFGDPVSSERPVLIEFLETDFRRSFFDIFDNYTKENGLLEIFYDRQNNQFELIISVTDGIYRFNFSQRSISYILRKALAKKVPIWNSNPDKQTPLIKYESNQEPNQEVLA